MRKTISFVGVLAATASLCLSGIFPAHAAGGPAFPDNQHFFAIDCNGDGYVWSVDTTNANSTRVGSGPSAGICGYGATTNPVDGLSYVLYNVGGSYYLGSVDTANGEITNLPDLTGDVIPSQIWQLIITNSGAAFVTTNSAGGWKFYSLDLTTSNTTLVGSMGQELKAVGYNPADDTIYGFTEPGNAYTIDSSSGVATADPAHDAILPSKYRCPNNSKRGLKLDGVAFDANGNPWFQNDGCDSELLVEDFATGIVYYKGQFNDASQSVYGNAPYFDFYTETIFITSDPVPPAPPAPALPATGTDALALESLTTVSGALLIVGATILVGIRRHLARK